MNTKQIIAELRVQDPDLLLADGFDEAVIGLVEGWIGPRRGEVVAYDYDRCLDILVTRDGMPREEAEEFLQFNTIGAYVGEYTPLFVHDWRRR